MRYSLFCFVFFSVGAVFAQEAKLPAPMIESDTLYREDQFYFAFTYNLVLNRPEGVSQNKFSSGFKGGFLKDMPFNKQRNKAVAVGFGMSYNKYLQNLIIRTENNKVIYNTTTAGVPYQKNKIEEVFVDIPIEYRWRTSTPDSHKFWRVYTGLQLSYLVYNKSVYQDSQYQFNVSNNPGLTKFQAGVYIAWGYNTWNFYGYYGVTPLFKPSERVNTAKVDFNSLNFGLMFYIL